MGSKLIVEEFAVGMRNTDKDNVALCSTRIEVVLGIIVRLNENSVNQFYYFIIPYSTFLS